MPTDSTTVLPFPHRSGGARRPAARTGARLQPTARGRALLLVIAFLAGLAVAALSLLVLDVPAALAGSDRTQVTVTVEHGDTLWEYAERYAPEGMSEQEYITEVRSINHLPTGRVTTGQQIELPTEAGLGR